jgi:hypothetical protein
MQGCGRQQAVDSGHGAPGCRLQAAPAVSYGGVYGQNTAGEKCRQLHFHPIQQPEFALAVGQHLNAFADLAQC